MKQNQRKGRDARLCGPHEIACPGGHDHKRGHADLEKLRKIVERGILFCAQPGTCPDRCGAFGARRRRRLLGHAAHALITSRLRSKGSTCADPPLKRYTWIVRMAVIASI